MDATPWLRREPAADAAIAAFLRATRRLPSWAPASSARHAVSSLLPPARGVAELLRALHGRLVVVNHPPVAAVPRRDAVLVRGLARAALDGLPPASWPAAARGHAASWPADSQAAHAQAEAQGWLARADATRAFGPANAVRLALYEGPLRIATADGADAELPADVRAHLARRLPPRALALPRIVALIDYRLAVVTARSAEVPVDTVGTDTIGTDTIGTDTIRADTIDADARVLGPALGDRASAGVWFAGSLLLPDAAVVAAMDARSRQRWAAVTGRAGGADVYWHPTSWARHLEAGRTLGYVTPAAVGRSVRGGRRAGGATAFNPGVERGVTVPPGYALVDCAGTFGVNVVVG